MNIFLLGTALLACVVLAAARPSTKEHEQLLKRLSSLAISKKDSTDCVDDDIDASCNGWAEDGYCDSQYSEFMLQYCKKSCHVCNRDISHISPNLTIFVINDEETASEETNATTVGKHAFIGCGMDYPRRAIYHYMKDGVEVFTWEWPVLMFSWFDIPSANISDSGVYTCRAYIEGSGQSAVSNAVPLTVLDPEPVDEVDNEVVRLLEKLVEKMDKKELDDK